MAEQAAHLVEAVLPWVPVRQWVLTVPYRLRYLLAFDHALCRAVLGVVVRTLLGWYRRRARRAGVADGRSGTVTVVQRFGSGLELNVHLHVLGLDGVFAAGVDGTLRFHRLPPPTDADIAVLVTTVARRLGRSSPTTAANSAAAERHPYELLLAMEPGPSGRSSGTHRFRSFGCPPDRASRRARGARRRRVPRAAPAPAASITAASLQTGH